ncbi:hypothetical protein ADIWIN_3957 [Winogradskyella psychrotolerans RS-3]|uniref:PrcB C-terminal domain-containing protein n=1 Tax=Winogradskyella psychrotolerans RS-3 TaxID=641526 RepID=S7WTN4_9FLAO|nr:hypothetical protein [Winogradskyella psychrotolerans]EPR70094.1 hypothetical protein ADIWIN_3957 [Winogradskyella psychrotolerans RS-3]
MKIQALILLSLVFVLSCKSSKIEENNAKMKNSELILIAKGNLHGAGEEGIAKQNTVIDNQSDWEHLMTQMNTTNKVSESFTETKIDFSKYAIIAVFNDVKGNGGSSIDLEVSTSSENNTVVTVTYVAPTGYATSVMTQPFYIAKIPKTDLSVVFQ